MTFIKYLLFSNVCLIVFFTLYKLVFRKEGNFVHLRIFLLASIFLSIILPFNSMNIDLGFNINQAPFTIQQDNILPETPGTKTNSLSFNEDKNLEIKKSKINLDFYAIGKWIYLTISLLIVIRLIFEIIKLGLIYMTSAKEKFQNLVIASNPKANNTFSFFNIVYINKKGLSKDDYLKITSHEKIHAQQYHSLDLILIELLSAVMWFNPFVWLMRSEIKLVHEYLADEGALSTGIDRLGYQALLVNQLTEERLICLSSSFNPAWPSGKHSLKKRMIMMTKSKFNHKTKLRILALLPVTLMLFLGIACVNGQSKGEPNANSMDTPAKPKSNYNSNVAKQTPQKGQVEHLDTTLATVKLLKADVLYLGVANPIHISAKGIEDQKVYPSITNGSIKKIGDEKYVINSRRPGNSLINVLIKENNKSKSMGVTAFRVRSFPVPQAEVAGLSGGKISKKTLLEQKQLQAVLRDFVFNPEFLITEFIIRAVNEDGYLDESKSSSNMFTNDQIELIKNIPVGNRISFEAIKCQWPEGLIKDIPSIVFEVEE